MASSTTTPRLTARPAAWASAAFGPDAHRHDQQVAGQHAAVLQLQAGDLAVRADDLLRMGAQHRLDAAFRQGLGEQEAGATRPAGAPSARPSGGRPWRPCRAGPGRRRPRGPAGRRRSPRRLAPGLPAAATMASTSSRSRKVTTPFRSDARQRQAERVGPRGQDQLVVGDAPARPRPPPCGRSMSIAVTARPACRVMPLSRVPGLVVDHDVGEGLLPASTGDSMMRL